MLRRPPGATRTDPLVPDAPRFRAPDTDEVRRSGLRPRRLLSFAATVGETHPRPTLPLKGRAQTRGLRPRRLLLNEADASVPVAAPPAAWSGAFRQTAA